MSGLESSYIQTLAARLELLLPTRTGYILAEVELNAHFVVTANLLLQSCRRLNDQEHYTGEIMDSLIRILKKINFDLSNKLIERDINALSSTLIVSKLLMTIVSEHWTNPSSETDSADAPDVYINLDLLHSEESFDMYLHPPPNSLDIDVQDMLETLFSILSPRVNRLAYSRLRRKQESFTDCDFSVSAHLSLTYNELLAYMTEIDTNLIMVIRFLAAANPEDYFEFVKENLLSNPDRGDKIAIKYLLKYSCLLMFAYTNPQYTDKYLKLIYKCIPYINSNTWTQLFLYYACLGLEYQCSFIPGFYTANFYPNSPAETHCKLLFDYASTAYENNTPELLSFFLIFALACPSDFDEVVVTSNVFKNAFNKRVKFLSLLIKSSQSSFDHICYESLNKIFMLAVRVDSKGGVREFAKNQIEEAYHNLLKYRPHHSDIASTSLYRAAFVDISIAALMLHPQRHVELFLDIFDQTTNKVSELFQSSQKTHDLSDLLKIVKGISKYSEQRELSSTLIAKINPTLQRIMRRTTTILSSDKSMCYDSLDTSDDSSLINESLESPIESRLDNIVLTENVHNSILELYAEHPSYFIVDYEGIADEDMNVVVGDIAKTAQEIFLPLNAAIRFKCSQGSLLFKSACAVTLKLLDSCADKSVPKNLQCIRMLLSHEFIYLTCEVLICLSDNLFKEYFITLNNFSHRRHYVLSQMNANEYLINPKAHYACARICGSVDKLLVLSLCTHKVQFLSLAKSFMKCYLKESVVTIHSTECFKLTLLESFQSILDDDTMFSGFVSLNRQFKALLSNAEPTQGLCEAWVLIYRRWLDMIEDKRKLSEESFAFKNFTEFLVCTSGVLLGDNAATTIVGKDSIESIISAFFDKALTLLHSDELFIRVVVRDALSSESKKEVYLMTVKKLMNTVYSYKQQGHVEQGSVLFIEEAILVFASMVSLDNEYSFVLTSLYPGASKTMFDTVELVSNVTDQIKVKLRLCKMMSAVSTDREKLGLCGAHQLRNIYAKTAASWLSSAVSFDADNTAQTSGAKTTDTEYLKIELATECSKSLELQLQSLILVVPDETKEANYLQAKERVFSEYFTLFYQILENFNSENPSPLMKRSKFKTQAIVDNILKAISNILRANSEVGMQFALPLGYHGNPKMRAIFLEIFAATLTIGEVKLAREEFPDEVVQELSNVYPIYGAAAEAASPAEHNLLATSLHGLFGYTMALDKLFVTLLEAEIYGVARSTDIFRSNSTLTRLMSIFAKEYGLPYLTVIVRPFIEDIIDDNITFEVERGNNEEDSSIFIKCLQRLVDSIVTSISWVPDTFKFICSQINKCISTKFASCSLIGVGSFLFLRFFCPAIVSPESFFDLTSIDPKVKRSLIQLVKVIQYMANGSISNLKWESLANYSKELEEMKNKIFTFMKDIALGEELEGYQFHRLTVKPLTSLRYIHKFLHTYFIVIRHNYVVENALSRPELKSRITIWRRLDKVFCELGHPKLYISLQGTKSVEPQLNIGNAQFSEFMAKMSAKNIELSVDTPAVRTSVFHDGTPTIVVNFRYIRDVGYDMNTFVYLLLECASQVWEKNYYCVFDFSEFFYMGIIGNNYVNLMKSYAPLIYYANFSRAYYYNLPRAQNLAQIEAASEVRERPCKLYFYSEQDDPEVTNALCLEDPSSMRQDVRLVCESCRLYDDITEEFQEVTIKLGRQWLQIWFERFDYKSKDTMTDTVAPVETHLLTDLLRCEVSFKSGEQNEFTLFLNRFNYQVTLVTPRRQEILRFLYFAKLRSTKQSKGLKSSADGIGIENLKRFSILSNLMFHGLLNKNEDLRLASSKLVTSFLSYFGVIKDFPSSSVISVAFPDDTTEYVAQYSAKLAENFPQYTYMFVKAFFDGFEKLPKDLRLAGISYLSPWIHNLSGNLYREKDGASKLSYTIRHLAKITTANKKLVPFFATHIWKRLSEDRRITSVLVDELVSLAVENVSDEETWTAITSLLSPGVEICGELIFKLNDCILKTKVDDPDIAIQSKQLEIKVLLKICASIFFNSYIFASLYLLEVFLFCTLFIAGPSLDIGHELQRLVLNTIQSFSMKPHINQGQRDLINDTLTYFSGQRAKMLFGLTAKEGGKTKDKNQSFDKAQSFELLFEHLEDFIENIGSVNDKRRWMARWSSISKDMAFGDSYYRDRALSVVCTLARSGISDSSGGKILGLMARRIAEEDVFLLENSVGFYRLERGFADDSVYLPSIVWIVLSGVLMELPFNYQAMTTYLGRTLERLVMDETFLHKTFEKKESLNEVMNMIEDHCAVRTTYKNFELVFLILMSKGLTLHRQRFTSISNYELVLSFKAKYEDQQTTENFTCSFLLMYYLSVSNTTFVNFLDQAGFQDMEFLQIGKDSIPKSVVQQLCNGNLKMKITFLIAAYIFSRDCDQIFRWKFVALFTFVSKELRELSLTVFHIIQESLQKSLSEHVSITSINEISKTILHVVQDKNYDVEFYKTQVSAIMKEFSLQGLEESDFFKSSSTLSREVIAEKVGTVLDVVETVLSDSKASEKLDKY